MIAEHLAHPDRHGELDVLHLGHRALEMLIGRTARQGEAIIGPAEQIEIIDVDRHLAVGVLLQYGELVFQHQIGPAMIGGEGQLGGLLQGVAEFVAQARLIAPIRMKPGDQAVPQRGIRRFQRQGIFLRRLEPIGQRLPKGDARLRREGDLLALFLVLDVPDVGGISRLAQHRIDGETVTHRLARDRTREAQRDGLHRIAKLCGALGLARREQKLGLIVGIGGALQAEKGEIGKAIEAGDAVGLLGRLGAFRGDHTGIVAQGNGLAGRQVAGRLDQPHPAIFLAIDHHRRIALLHLLGQPDHFLLMRQRQPVRQFSLCAIRLGGDLIARPLPVPEVDMVEHGRFRHRLGPEHADDRSGPVAPQNQIAPARLRPLGQEAAFIGLGDGHAVQRLDAWPHLDVILGGEAQLLFFVQLAGKAAGIEPAPLAGHRRRDVDRDLGGAAVHLAYRHHRPVELDDNLAARQHVGAVRRNPQDRQLPRLRQIGRLELGPRPLCKTQTQQRRQDAKDTGHGGAPGSRGEEKTTHRSRIASVTVLTFPVEFWKSRQETPIGFGPPVAQSSSCTVCTTGASNPWVSCRMQPRLPVATHSG